MDPQDMRVYDCMLPLPWLGICLHYNLVSFVCEKEPSGIADVNSRTTKLGATSIISDIMQPSVQFTWES